MIVLTQWNKKKRIWTSDIEEMTKDLIPLAKSTNAGEALMTTDHDDKWSLSWDSGRKISIGHSNLSIMAYTYKYPRPAVTADCIVITRETEPKVLLIERGDEPFKGCWAFPGGFMNMDETTEQCSIRELEEETGLQISDMHQIGAYSKVDRDPRGRTVTVAYLAIIDEPVAVTGQDDAAKAEWWPLSDLPHLAFDHYDIMQDAIALYNQTK